MSHIVSPLYCVGRLWEKNTIKQLIARARSSGLPYFRHPLSRAFISTCITFDSHGPTAQRYIASVTRRLPDSSASESSEEEDDGTIVRGATTVVTTNASTDGRVTAASSHKQFPIDLHIGAEGIGIMTSMLQLGKAEGWLDTFGHGKRTKHLEEKLPD